MQFQSLGKAFDRLWYASLTSNTADGLLFAALPLLAAALTQDPVMISLNSALSSLPWLLFAVVIGGVTDRVNRRWLLAGSQLVRAGVAMAVGLLVHTGHMTFAALCLGTFVWGVCEVVGDTTSQALIPQMLSADQLEQANSRLNVSETVLQNFIGVPLGGWLYVAVGALPFALGGVGIAISAVLVFAIPRSATALPPRDPEHEHHSFWQDIRFGISYLYNHAKLRRLVLFTSTLSFLYSAAHSTFVLFALNEVHIPREQFGAAMMLSGIGGLIGASMTPRWSSRWGRGRVMTIAMTAQTGLIALEGLSPNIYWFVPIAAVGMVTMSAWNILLMSCYQVLIPNHLYGRIHGARRTLVWGVGPIGSLVGGLIAVHGLRLPFVICGLLAALVTLFNVTFVRELATATVAE